MRALQERGYVGRMNSTDDQAPERAMEVATAAGRRGAIDSLVPVDHECGGR